MQIINQTIQFVKSPVQVWLRGLLAAFISGAANGVVSGFAAIGIDPEHFNLVAGLGDTLKISVVAGVFNAFLGLAMFLRQSPLPDERGQP